MFESGLYPSCGHDRPVGRRRWGRPFPGSGGLHLPDEAVHEIGDQFEDTAREHSRQEPRQGSHRRIRELRYVGRCEGKLPAGDREVADDAAPDPAQERSQDVWSRGGVQGEARHRTPEGGGHDENGEDGAVRRC